MSKKKNNFIKWQSVINIMFIILIYCPINYSFARQYPEKQYQEKWCEEHNGKMEIVLESGERSDCITDEYAIEFDFAKKYCEAVGQSLLYAIESKRKPGIVLILEDEKEKKYLRRLLVISNVYNIKVWVINLEYLK